MLEDTTEISPNNSNSDTDQFGQCQRPAIEQFPQPLMDKASRQKGGLIVHIAVAVYMFIGLAIVCDDYFVPALDRISEGTLYKKEIIGN